MTRRRLLEPIASQERCVVTREEPECLQIESEGPDARDVDTDAWLQRLALGVELPEREFRLYARYVRALALLCECAPFVDEPDYVDLIDELLADAWSHYPLACRRDGDRREIAPRPPALD